VNIEKQQARVRERQLPYTAHKVSQNAVRYGNFIKNNNEMDMKALKIQPPEGTNSSSNIPFSRRFNQG
jgi:hypothetical protein